jgi:hypothetical protein
MNQKSSLREVLQFVSRVLTRNNRMFVTDFAGSIYSAKLDGSGERNFLYAQGNLTGIAYTEI